jgi:hypothetical protein
MSRHKKDAVYIYVLRMSTGPVKVGVARDPEHRALQVQTGNPYAVSVAHVHGPVERDQAREIERDVHGLLADYRLVGEWFDCSDQLASDAIVNVGWHP